MQKLKLLSPLEPVLWTQALPNFTLQWKIAAWVNSKEYV